MKQAAFPAVYLKHVYLTCQFTWSADRINNWQANKRIASTNGACRSVEDVTGRMWIKKSTKVKTLSPDTRPVRHPTLKGSTRIRVWVNQIDRERERESLSERHRGRERCMLSWVQRVYHLFWFLDIYIYMFIQVEMATSVFTPVH